MTIAQPGRPNIYDVARAAGVSHTTVSRVLNDSPRTRESTRRRVLRAIEEMSYTPSLIARALATQTTMRLGMLVDSPVHYGPNTTMRAFESAARRAGYTLTAFTVTDDTGAGMEEGVADLIAQGIDGLCVVAPRDASLEVLRQQAGDVPVVVISSEPRDGVRSVRIDQHAGATRAVTHLVGLGHRRIVHLAGPDSWFDARARRRGWEDAMSAAGLPLPAVTFGDWTSDAGYEFARALEPDAATAVFAANDQMALGVIRGLVDRGLRVPHDVSVIGFDDLPDARHYLPPLTTVRQDFAGLGAIAVGRILHALAGVDELDDSAGVLSPQLIVRDSTAAVPASAP